MLHGNFWPKTCQCPHIENNTIMYNLGGWNALVQYSAFSEFDYLWLFVEEHGTRALHTIVLLILHTVWLFLTISDKACARLWLLVTKCAQFGGLAKTWSRITAKHRLLFPCQTATHLIIIFYCYIMCGLLSPRDLWQGTLTWESYYRGRQNVGAYKKRPNN